MAELRPTVCVAHLDHRAENRVPGVLFEKHLIREHAAIPTDVLEALGRRTAFSQPVS